MLVNITEVDDDVKGIDPELAKKYLAKLEADEVVSTETILSLESEACRVVIPNGIRNMVSTIPSRLGYSEVKDYIEAAIQETPSCIKGPDNLMFIMTRVLELINRHMSQGIRGSIETLTHEVTTVLPNIYMSDKWRESTGIQEDKLTDMHMGVFLDNTAAFDSYLPNNSVAMRAVLQYTNTINLNCLELCATTCDLGRGSLILDDTRNMAVMFDGTLEQFLLRVIKLMKRITSYDLVMCRTEFLRQMDFARCYPEDHDDSIVSPFYNQVRTDEGHIYTAF